MGNRGSRREDEKARTQTAAGHETGRIKTGERKENAPGEMKCDDDDGVREWGIFATKMIQHDFEDHRVSTLASLSLINTKKHRSKKR